MQIRIVFGLKITSEYKHESYSGWKIIPIRRFFVKFYCATDLQGFWYIGGKTLRVFPAKSSQFLRDKSPLAASLHRSLSQNFKFNQQIDRSLSPIFHQALISRQLLSKSQNSVDFDFVSIASIFLWSPKEATGIGDIHIHQNKFSVKVGILS